MGRSRPGSASGSGGRRENVPAASLPSKSGAASYGARAASASTAVPRSADDGYRSRSSGPASSRCSFRRSNSGQMLRLLHNAQRPGRRKVPGEQGISRQVRGTGVFGGAHGSSPTLLMMADEARREPVPRQDDRAPHMYRFATKENNCVAAGVESGRMAEIVGDNLDNHPPAVPVYFPPTYTDPLTHKEFPDEEIFRCSLGVQGAAGCRTHHLAYLNNCAITTQPTFVKSHLDMHAARTDPISHIAGPPEQQTTGLRRIPIKSGAQNPILKHTHRPIAKPSGEEVREMLRTRETKAATEVLYRVAGDEDCMPAASRPFVKSDRPASARYAMENERWYLASCDRKTPRRAGNVAMLESEDMFFAMHGPEHGPRRMAMERIGREHIEEESGYGPNWVAIEMAKGGNGKVRARSAEPARQGTAMEIGGILSDRESHGAERPPLRWPSHQAIHAPLSARNGQAFRAPNGCADWAGLNGLGIWSSARKAAQAGAATDRSPSARGRTPSAERSNLQRSPTPPRPTPQGWSFRSPPGMPGLVTLHNASPKAMHDWQQAMLASGGNDGHGTQPHKWHETPTFDSTRERGAEFPRTPKGKSRTPLDTTRPKGMDFAQSPAPQGNTKANTGGKGAWSRPESMKLSASPAGDFSEVVFSL